MYAFLRQRKNTAYAAFLGALSFEFLPKLFVHYAAGHISWVQAITWTPWLLLLQQNRYKLSCKSRAYWYQSCVMYALILLCDLRWVAYAFILDGLFFINQLWINKPVNLRDFLIKIAGWISQIIGGLFLSAIFLIPFFEYLRLTDRSKLLANDILNYGLPVGKLLGLIIPDMGGYAEYFVYPGLLVWISFLGVFSLPLMRRKYRLFLIFIGVCFLYSLGSAIPGLSWIYTLPGINLLRVPSRIFFVIHLCMILMTSDYLTELEGTGVMKKTLNLLPAFFTLIFVSAFLLVLVLTENEVIFDFIWPFIIASAFFILFGLKKYVPWLSFYTTIALVVIALLDYSVVNATQIDRKSVKETFSENQVIYTFLSTEKEENYRVYSPSYHMEQHAAAYYQVQLVDGVDPLHLWSYVQFIEKASGVSYDGYSVTLPPYFTGDPKTDNQFAIPNSTLLGLLNTKYIIADYPIQAQGLHLIDLAAESYLYRNENFLPRAWVENEEGISTHSISNMIVSSNQIQLNVQGPGRLVLSEVYYPGWVATINNVEVPIKLAHEILRAIELPSGKSQVNFTYRPFSLFLGAWLTGVCLVLLMSMGLQSIKQGRQDDHK